MNNKDMASEIVDRIDEEFAEGFPSLTVKERRVMAMLSVVKWSIMSKHSEADIVSYVDVAMKALQADDEVVQ